ncbi:HIRA-interacting protein 3 isoform X2 [Chelmon rostratus]|uniref:HIRA-interacting protein 3 isoform X2 n=1 Tax=Chelmon rostratus TaxID=109905 RepID=UPI001BE75609|nr:HIRA-interacting protein 3 isoform X2 [Chelmon rostratus]
MLRILKLTLGILKRRYLAHVRCESLSPEARNFMKKVVQEELMKMQDNDKNESGLESKKLQNKRKREKQNDEVISGEEDESMAKKSRCQSSSSSESEDKDDSKRQSEESEEEEQIKPGSEDEEQEVKRSQRKMNGNSKQQLSSEDSADNEINESEKEENESNCGDSPKEIMKKKASKTKNGGTGGSNTSQGKKTPQSDEENDTDTSKKSDKINSNDSSDDSEKEEKVLAEKKNNDSDSDSLSLSSLEDKQSGTEKTQVKKKKKTLKKEESTRGQKGDNKVVVRLKRYISLCGVRRNYKKLLDGCRSVRSQVAVLKKELEDLGVHGQPSIKKCRKVRMKREEAQELADLDVSNIIATQGRPKRRGSSAWHPQHDPPSSTYVRSLNSSSDSDQENYKSKGHRRATDLANLKGIISDDANSD